MTTSPLASSSASVVAEVLMHHLLTPFGRCLCGFELDVRGVDAGDGEAEWSVHVAEILTQNGD